MSKINRQTYLDTSRIMVIREFLCLILKREQIGK